MKCYRCGQAGHISTDCALPENMRLCSRCYSPKHVRQQCPLHFKGLELKLWVKIVSYLVVGDLLELRLVSHCFEYWIKELNFDFVMPYYQRAARVLRTRVLPGERCFNDFSSLGMKLLVRNLAPRVISTPIGKASVYMCMRSNGYVDLPLSRSKFRQKHPDASFHNYLLYTHAVHPEQFESDKLEQKAEVKALKCVYKFLSIKYAKLGFDYNQIADQRKYSVVLRDIQFIRRLGTEIRWLITR